MVSDLRPPPSPTRLEFINGGLPSVALQICLKHRSQKRQTSVVGRGRKSEPGIELINCIQTGKFICGRGERGESETSKWEDESVKDGNLVANEAPCLFIWRQEEEVCFLGDAIFLRCAFQSSKRNSKGQGLLSGELTTKKNKKTKLTAVIS